MYTVNNNVFDIYLATGFGVIGYLMRKFDFEASPLILAVVLGPMMEKALRQSLEMSAGDFSIFASRPICGMLFGIALLLLILPLAPKVFNRAKIASLEE